jgi:methylmalonyl-CoA mutase cobalamin-binding subunit
VNGTKSKQNRRYKPINFIGLQNNHHPSQHTVGRHVAAIQERVTAVLRSIPKEAFADSFQKLYERCQQCVVKDADYFGGQ